MQKYNKNCTMVDNANKPQLAQYLTSGLALNILELQLDFQRSHHPTLHPQPLLGQKKTTLLKDNFSVQVTSGHTNLVRSLLPVLIPLLTPKCRPTYQTRPDQTNTGLYPRPEHKSSLPKHIPFSVSFTGKISLFFEKEIGKILFF